MKSVVEIKGGFGNQIFQYAYARHLKNKGHKVKINFQNHLNQRQMLNYKIFGFPKASKILVLIVRLLYRLSESNKTKYFSNLLFKKLFSKFSKLEDFKIINAKPLNHFDGYWQSVEILEEQKDYIVESLMRIDSFKNFMDQPIEKGSTLIHVRRGDYKTVDEELKVEFYEEALNFCRANIDNFTFEVFTDDVNWVNQQKVFDKAKNINGETETFDDLLADIFKMFSFENYVVGNSSFSLVPAVLSEGANSKILVADPWFRNSKRDLKIKDSWTKIINK